MLTCALICSKNIRQNSLHNRLGCSSDLCRFFSALPDYVLEDLDKLDTSSGALTDTNSRDAILSVAKRLNHHRSASLISYLGGRAGPDLSCSRASQIMNNACHCQMVSQVPPAIGLTMTYTRHCPAHPNPAQTNKCHQRTNSKNQEAEPCARRSKCLGSFSRFGGFNHGKLYLGLSAY